MTVDSGTVRPVDLATDGRTSPEAVVLDSSPRFSWRVDDTDWGHGQSAYRAVVARSRDALGDGQFLWDSGRVESADSVDVGYGGPPLAADERYHWAVRVWNDEGDASAWSDPATFATAPERIDADWITGATRDTNGHRSAWVAPEDGSEWVQVDLGESTSVTAVELHPTEPFGGPTTPDGKVVTARDTEETYRERTAAQGPVGFGFPASYRVAVADDPGFADATVVAEGDERVRREPAVHGVSATGRYVRVTATDLDSYAGGGSVREEHGDWSVFALAAVVVRDGAGDDAALGAPVRASTTVEDETWGRANLTDGVRESRQGDGSPRLRTEFDLTKPVADARVHVAGLGYGELYANGEKVGDSVLDPGWTQTDERVLYRTYDVSDHLGEGENALGLWLGRGWYGKPVRQWPAKTAPRGALRLTVTYRDGTTRAVTTGPNWETAPSPIETNDIYDGERYDARREQPGWVDPGFDGEWASAPVVDSPAGDCYPQQTDPIRVTDSISPDAVYEREDGPVVDFGQNTAGWVELTVRGAERGDEITVRHAEALNDDGSLQTIDLRTARATDTYVAAGGETETYEPRFTYHGFRYAQIEGYPGDLSAEDVTMKVVHTDFEDAGEFACADEELTRVHENARWGLRSNAHSVPTDCPQRDERQGFTGDAHLAGPALHYNFDAGRFHGKFLRDHADAQSPHGYLPSKVPNGSEPGMTGVTWTYSYVSLAWLRYRHDASAASLRELYPGLCRFVEFWHEVAEDGLLPDRYTAYGDWVALENNDGRTGRPEELFTNAYYYRSTATLAKMAEALDCPGDAARHRERAGAIREAFTERYFDAGAASYGPGTQAANAVPLAFGMVPDGRDADVTATLAERVHGAGDSLRTGFLGTPALLTALTENGHPDLAYAVATHREFPGWVYMLHDGATTVWERWDTDEQVGSRMNSRNHSPFCLVSAYCFEGVAGLRVTDALPAERRVDLAPGLVSDLDWAEASVDSPYGEVATRWERDGDALDVSVSVPWNLTAAVDLPDEATLDGEDPGDHDAVLGVESAEGGTRVELASGEHVVRVEKA